MIWSRMIFDRNNIKPNEMTHLQQSKCNELYDKVDVQYKLLKLKNYVLCPGTKNFMHHDAEIDLPIARALLSTQGNSHRASVNNYVTTNGRIRALTVRETYRLMGFPDSFKIVVSKAQALKQSGNSIVVDVLIAILKNIESIGGTNGKN